MPGDGDQPAFVIATERCQETIRMVEEGSGRPALQAEAALVYGECFIANNAGACQQHPALQRAVRAVGTGRQVKHKPLAIRLEACCYAAISRALRRSFLSVKLN